MNFRSLLTISLLFLSGIPLRTIGQEKNITVTVKDEKTNELIRGATLTDATHSQSYISDQSGRIYLPASSSMSRIVVSMLGYQTEQLVLKEGKSEWTISLLSQENDLSEVVVTGYTKQSRAHTTGAVSSLPAEGIARMPVASFDQSLQGQIPGLYVASPSGQPGAPGRITLRGIGSIQDENSAPLYILDGVPISAGSFSTLNPQSFENITVLKDAASTAQYGSRGANGVIVITSKKGNSWENGTPRISYTGQFGYASVNNSKWDMMNTKERLLFEERLQDPNFPGWAHSRNNPNKLVNGALMPKTEKDFLEGDEILANLRGIDNDWRKLLLRNGTTNAHDVSYSLGKENTQIFSSLSYFNQEGVLYNSGLERINLTNNIAHQSGRLSLALNVNLATTNSKISESDFDVSETNPVASLYFALPYENPYDKNGNLTPGPNRFGTNALSMYQDVDRRERQYKSVVTGNFASTLTEHLKLTSTSGVDFQQINGKHIIKPDTYFGSLVEQGGQGSYTSNTNNYFSIVSNIGFNYSRRWDNHFIEAIGLGEINKQKISSQGFTGYGLVPGLSQTPGGITPGTAENNLIPQLSGGISENALVSQIGLLRYSNGNRFTVTGSLRRDGSSRVPESNRYKYFYAGGASWNLGEEEFVKALPIISMWRLRASYGLTGNASGFASDFGYRRLYAVSHYAGQNAFVPVSAGNPNYNWEMNRVTDIGTEIGFLNNRITAEVDFYNRVTSNLFVDRTLSMTSGFESVPDNMGKIRNRGIEFGLSGDLIRKDDFFIRLGINGSYNRNRILSLGDEDEIVTEDYSIHRVGQPLGHFYMVRWAGVDPQTGAPQYLDADGEITSTFDPDNAVLVKGSFDPPLKGGFTARVGYKGLQVSALFTYIKGMYRLNTGELYRTSADANYRIYNQSRDMLDFWQQPGDQSGNPSPQYERFMTDRELQSADYIKLRNLQINYSIPMSNKLSKYCREISVFGQGQNLWTWTKWKGQDPEDDNNWYQYEYPLPRTYTLGLHVKF